jgi:hypothetical protein
MKIKLLPLFVAAVLVLAGSVAAFGQRVQNIKFPVGATSTPVSGSVSGKNSKLYRVRVLRGSVLFLQTRGNVSYKVFAAGRWFAGAAGAFDAEWISSNFPELVNKNNFLIKVFSASGRRENFTLFVGASALK